MAIKSPAKKVNLQQTTSVRPSKVESEPRVPSEPSVLVPNESLGWEIAASLTITALPYVAIGTAYWKGMLPCSVGDEIEKLLMSSDFFLYDHHAGASSANRSAGTATTFAGVQVEDEAANTRPRPHVLLYVMLAWLCIVPFSVGNHMYGGIHRQNSELWMKLDRSGIIASSWAGCFLAGTEVFPRATVFMQASGAICLGVWIGVFQQEIRNVFLLGCCQGRSDENAGNSKRKNETFATLTVKENQIFSAASIGVPVLWAFCGTYVLRVVFSAPEAPDAPGISSDPAIVQFNSGALLLAKAVALGAGFVLFLNKRIVGAASNTLWHLVLWIVVALNAIGTLQWEEGFNLSRVPYCNTPRNLGSWCWALTGVVVVLWAMVLVVVVMGK